MQKKQQKFVSLKMLDMIHKISKVLKPLISLLQIQHIPNFKLILLKSDSATQNLSPKFLLFENNY